MKLSHLRIRLSEAERAAIWALAEAERRDPRDQAAHIIARELTRLGMLDPGDHRAAQPAGEGNHATT